MPSTISPLEIGWTVFCFLGALASIGLSWDVWTDARAVYRDGTNGRRRATTRLAVALAMSKVYTLLMFVVVGVIVMTQPQRNNSPGQIASAVGFCSVAVVIVSVGLYWRRVRGRWFRDEGRVL